MADITQHLQDVWRDLWQVFGSNNSWMCDQAEWNDIQQRLSYFYVDEELGYQ